jgi:ATP/maltotriose-dependent transcriptional regulator MalT
MREVQLARDRLGDPPGQSAIGLAYYEQGELHRMRGEFSQAEKAYQQAHQMGREPQPGLSLLWLHQGRHGVAASAIKRAVDECFVRNLRARLLTACVEASIACGSLDDAAQASAELAMISDELDAPMLHAMSDHQAGALQLAVGEADQALTLLRRAWRGWQDLEAPYEAARVRVLIGLSCRGLGDLDSAELELDAASQIFAQLGAAPDMIRLDALHDPSAAVDRHGLTQRELEVLRLLVTGNTNHAIAAQLVVSDHTVRRHVQNIFAKLGVSSRAAATAFALQHDLL